LKKKGVNYTEQLVEYHLKFSFPCANFIMALLAAPFATRIRRTSDTVLGFCICLLVAFIYVGFIQVGRALGGGGLLSPFWSVWIANLVFAVLGFWGIYKANR
jgi:lipopolysaccharide export LptBFGC system permease protein LptF